MNEINEQSGWGRERERETERTKGILITFAPFLKIMIILTVNISTVCECDFRSHLLLLTFEFIIIRSMMQKTINLKLFR
jgi:hypothetical protein